MRLYKLLFGLASAMALSVTTAMAEDTAPTENAAITLATEYLKAYSTFDVTNMAPYYSDDAVFLDPTASRASPDGQPLFAFNGKDAIIKGLGDYALQYKSFTLDYKIERQYESNNVVVFVAQLTYKGEGKNGNTFEGGAPIVTAITVKDGKIVRHMDYFDYKENAENFTE